ncbi:hypothetical protein ACFL08_03420 [Patescibacteria group bacterium]
MNSRNVLIFDKNNNIAGVGKISSKRSIGNVNICCEGGIYGFDRQTRIAKRPTDEFGRFVCLVHDQPELRPQDDSKVVRVISERFGYLGEGRAVGGRDCMTVSCPDGSGDTDFDPDTKEAFLPFFGKCWLEYNCN